MMFNLATVLVYGLFSFNLFAATFENLNETDRAIVEKGELVSVPVKLDGNGLVGANFQFIPDVSPLQIAAVFFDFENHARYLPGMTSSRVLKWGNTTRVKYHFNPSIFVFPSLEKMLFRCIYHCGTFAYELDEEVKARDGTYTISWKMPEDTKYLRAEEFGSFEFKPFGSGTLLSYNNHTEPFFFEYILKRWPEAKLVKYLRETSAKMAASYYRNTVESLVRETRRQLAEDPEWILNDQIKDLQQFTQ